MVRWVGSCCDTPVFITAANPRQALVGVVLAGLGLSDRDDVLDVIGPVRAHTFVPRPDGRWRHDRGDRVARAMLARAVRANVTGRWRQTPFVNPTTGRPDLEPVLLPRTAGR